MDLEECGRDLAYDVAFWSLGLSEPSYPARELGRLSMELVDKFRSLAIMALLAKGDCDAFYHHLIRGARARQTYLSRLAAQSIDDDHHQASGRFDAVINAVAAADFDLAREIAELSPSEWRQGHEYEDDYCYAQLLHGFVQQPVPEDELPSVADRLEAYLDGEPLPRLDVCRALLSRDQGAFDEAFADLIDWREAEIAAAIARSQAESPPVMVQRLVFVEGLAVLRLAEHRGLVTQDEYDHCPSMARLPMRQPFPGE